MRQTEEWHGGALRGLLDTQKDTAAVMHMVGASDRKFGTYSLVTLCARILGTIGEQFRTRALVLILMGNKSRFP